METLVIYYSLTGNTRFVAGLLAKELSCDTFELKTVKPYPSLGFRMFYFAGRDAVFHRRIRLEKPFPDLSRYSVILLAAPVWAGTVSSPLYSYIRSVDFSGKSLYLVATSSGGSPKKCFSSVEKVCTNGSWHGAICFAKAAEEHWEEQAVLDDFCQAVKQGKPWV